MTCVVYVLEQSTRVRYVGITQDAVQRLRIHRSRRKGKEFEMRIVSEHDTRAEAGREEIRLIATLRTHVSVGGWNRSWGGEYADIKGYSRAGIGGRKKGNPGNVGWTPSDATRALWSNQRKGKTTRTTLNPDKVAELVNLYRSAPAITLPPRTSYLWEFCKQYCSIINATPLSAKNILTGKIHAWKHLL